MGRAVAGAQLGKLRRIPVDPALTPVPASQPGVKLFRVRLDSVGSHVQGYLAVPDRRGRFPALIMSKEYQAIGDHSRTTSYFLDMYLVRPERGAHTSAMMRRVA